MTIIPADIWHEAEKIIAEYFGDEEDRPIWTTRDSAIDILSSALHAERLTTEKRVREECAAKIKSMTEAVSRIAAQGWRGNPNMSGDDRDFMGPMQRRRHDERISEAIDFIAAAIREGRK